MRNKKGKILRFASVFMFGSHIDCQYKFLIGGKNRKNCAFEKFLFKIARSSNRIVAQSADSMATEF